MNLPRHCACDCINTQYSEKVPAEVHEQHFLLMQRLAAAEEQYDTGLRKLTATAKQIGALQRQVSSTGERRGTLLHLMMEPSHCTVPGAIRMLWP